MWEVPALVGIVLTFTLVPSLLPAIARVLPALGRFSGRQGFLIQLAGWLLAMLILAWLATGVAETAIGGWLPVSVTGMPLVLRLDLASVMVALVGAASLLSRWLRRGAASSGDGIIFAAWFCLACAASWPALLVALGILDFVLAFDRAAEHDATRLGRRNILNGVSVAMIGIACVVQLSQDASNYLPLATLTPHASWWAVGGAVLRVLASTLAPDSDGGVWSSASGFVLLGHFAGMQAPAIGPIWLAAIATFGLIRAAQAYLYRKVDGARRVALTAGLMSLASSAIWLPDAFRLAAIGLLLGDAMLAGGNRSNQNARLANLGVVALRGLGALTLIGLPTLPLFAASAGGMSRFLSASGASWLVLIALAFATLFLAASALDLVFALPNAPEVTLKNLAGWAGWIAGATCALLAFGSAFLLDGTRAFGRPTAAEWLLRLGGIALGGVLWFADTAITNRLNVMMGELWRVTLTQRVAEVLDMDWLVRALGRAMTRISRPFSAVFVFLESEGALLWTLVAILAIYLVLRSPGP